MVKGGKASFAETTGSILKFQIIVHVKNCHVFSVEKCTPAYNNSVSE